MRVMLWTAFAQNPIAARLQEISGVELVVAGTKEQMLQELPATEVLILLAVSYDAEVAAAVRKHAAQLRWIQLLTAGYDELKRHGVPSGVMVTNAGDAWSPGVAEHAITLLLALVKRVPRILAQQARHEWNRGLATEMGGLDGRTLAIVGFGSIGKEVARRARAFGMRVVGVSRRALPDPLADEVHPASTLHSVLAKADAVVIAVPSTGETARLFGRAEFEACKRGVVLINVARGAVVDYKQLMQALQSGAVGAAGLDVTDPEPLPETHPLWDYPNVIISPHVAGACGVSGVMRLANLVAENIGRYVSGQPVAHTVSV